jgi:hypothetical protein
MLREQMTTDSALIAALEHADAADRRLDALIALEIERERFKRVQLDADSDLRALASIYGIARYTASIDAALTLVPDNWYATIAARADGPACFLQEFPQPCRRVPDAPYVIRTGITPNCLQDEIAAAAISICIAAFKARDAIIEKTA